MGGRDSDTRWCSTCQEELVASYDDKGNCLWCGDATSKRARSRQKRPWQMGSRYTAKQLRALHLLHFKQGQSVRNLAQQTYEAAGYSSPHSAEYAISREWRRMGLSVRSHAEQTRLSKAKLRKRRRNGKRAPQCKGVRTQTPRAGERCRKPARQGSDFCRFHDPSLRDEVVAFGKKIRHESLDRELVPLAPLAGWLRQRHAELGTWTAVGQAIGRSSQLAHRLAKERKRDTIKRNTVEAILEADGTTFADEIYSTAFTDTLNDSCSKKGNS